MADATGGPAELDVLGYLTDPQAELERCAAQHWFARGMDEQGRPMALVLGYEHARTMLRDRRLSARSFTDNMIESGLAPETAYQLSPLFRRDGDEHRFFRGLLSAAFTPRSVERLRPLTAEVAARLADGIVVSGGTCEFVSAFATPLPPEVFTVLFGLPPEDRDRLAHWGSVVTAAFVPAAVAEHREAIETTAREMRAWSEQLIAVRRDQPADDLITGLLAVDVDGRRLDDDDITAVITGFVFAGTDTTRRQLTQLIVAFAEHPDSWEQVAKEPDLVPNAVEEVLRRYSIIPGLSRVALDAYDDDGLEVPEHDNVAASFLTANADPGTFACPHDFDVTRENAKDHLTFGWGPHFCVGAGLARVELQEGFRALLERFGPPTLDAGSSEPGDSFTTETLEVTFPIR